MCQKICILGDVNFSIGQDVIDGYGENEFARIREEEELSAVYLRPIQPNNTTNADSNNHTVTIETQEPKRQPSVRYVINPAHKRLIQGPGFEKNSTRSTYSRVG